MSRFVNPSEPRAALVVLIAALSFSAIACPFSDNYEIDGAENTGGGADGGAGGVGLPLSTTTTAMTSAAGGSADMCETPASPPGGACPAVCDSCEGTTCVMQCGGAGEEKCASDVLACPAGFACEVRCIGKDACKDASVMCPLGYGCHVSCSGDDSCKGTAIMCGGGECAVDCESPQACKEADFVCGTEGFCSCAGFAQPLQTSGCESACSCTGCE
jgi:hypothetical protein